MGGVGLWHRILGMKFSSLSEEKITFRLLCIFYMEKAKGI